MTTLRKRIREEYIHAKIYKWQFTPPFPHVLENCCYFGQTRQDFDVRTNKHKSDSVSDPKELGLHALWRQYPYDSYWKISLLEEEYFDDVVSAGEWMNQREIALIKENGGILRDMDAKLKQTLNLTSGGQCDPKKMYEGILAISRRKLNKVWPAFDKFYADNHHLRIPKNHTEEVNGKEIKLGQIVHSIRTLGCKLQHLDFKQWLDCHDFVYDERRAHLEMEVKPAFKQFYERENHLRIPTNHTENVNEKEVKLGQIVHTIRAHGCFLQYDDLKKWLDTHNFVYDEYRAHLEEEVWPTFKQFYEREEHLRITQNHKEKVNEKEINLGMIVNHIRTLNCFLQYKDFTMWLWCGCFKMHVRNGDENTSRWNKVFKKLKCNC
tara:strand:+ start:4773 stop:5909 length:1137 start_codon:yes stop_codon:yes gene_type:complete